MKSHCSTSRSCSGIPKISKKWAKIENEQDSYELVENDFSMEKTYTKDDVVNKSNNNLVTFNNSEDAKKRWRATCKEYGFKDGTEEMGKCILRIQELEFEQTKLQIQINTANQQAINETRAEQRAASQQRALKLQQENMLKEYDVVSDEISELQSFIDSGESFE